MHEKNCNERLWVFKYNADNQYYELIHSMKIDSVIVSKDLLNSIFKEVNAHNNNDFAYTVTSLNETPSYRYYINKIAA